VEPRTVVAGVPAIPLARWRRIVAIQARLPELWRKRESRGASGREGDEL
jgi:UDP-3-O-[3-hydroxymyristoyl] glucosamine N-acyltransferase